MEIDTDGKKQIDERNTKTFATPTETTSCFMMSLSQIYSSVWNSKKTDQGRIAYFNIEFHT